MTYDAAAYGLETAYSAEISARFANARKVVADLVDGGETAAYSAHVARVCENVRARINWVSGRPGVPCPRHWSVDQMLSTAAREGTHSAAGLGFADTLLIESMVDEFGPALMRDAIDAAATSLLVKEKDLPGWRAAGEC